LKINHLATLLRIRPQPKLNCVLVPLQQPSDIVLDILQGSLASSRAVRKNLELFFRNENPEARKNLGLETVIPKFYVSLSRENKFAHIFENRPLLTFPRRATC
jgi:hypothetical protein